MGSESTTLRDCGHWPAYPAEVAWEPFPSGAGLRPKRFPWLSVDESNRAEQQLRAAARQQEAVAHLGQQALAGAARGDLFQTAATLVARGLDIEFSDLLELRPEHRSLVLRAGQGWRDGMVGRTIVTGRPDWRW